MPTESQKLILLEDISRIVVSSHDLTETLYHITSLLAARMGVEVCSIYLQTKGRLLLRSSQGLDASAVGRVSMSPDEGLTGLVFQSGQPVNAPEASDHPRFKFFPGIGEERFHSYLGVPLIHRTVPIGVLTVQTTEPRRFTTDEVRLLVTAASQVSAVITNARLLEEEARPHPETEEALHSTQFLRGIGVSPGAAIGQAYPLGAEINLEAYSDPGSKDPEAERHRFEEALERSIADVERLLAKVTAALSEEDGAIFHAHLMMLEDRGLQEKVRGRIKGGESAAAAVLAVGKEYVEAFLRLDDPYLRERATDVRDIGQRLLRHLRRDGQDPERVEFTGPTVVLAEDLTPSQFVHLLQPNLVGLATAKGGRNSHTAILCRSAGIPAVVGIEGRLTAAPPGQPVILDGGAGLIYLSPGETVRGEYERLVQDSRKLNDELLSHIEEPAITSDGQRVQLFGNAALLSDVGKILQAGGEGIGLYRTEFPFLIRSTFPDEEEQVEIYSRILDTLEGRVATLRTLDVGGDKTLPYLPIPREENPHLGWRSIRVSLEMEEPFRIQLRALLRASRLGYVRIVFPMISTVNEMRRAKAILEEERHRLAATGIEIPSVPVGAMIEVPSAALSVDRLAPLVDFFSIGTNDLVQYVLAVDRANRRVAHLYEPLHPTILDLVARIVETARPLGRPVSVCGEMASRVLGAAGLLAMGVRQLSVSPGSLPRIRRLIQTVDLGRLEVLAGQIRSGETADQVRDLLRSEIEAQGVPPTLLSSN